jgi:hypothetical protein
VGTEIERKFLVKGDDWRRLGTPIRIAQGYLGDSIERVVRVGTAGAEAYITVKGLNTGITRLEYEYSMESHHGHGASRWQRALSPIQGSSLTGASLYPSLRQSGMPFRWRPSDCPSRPRSSSKPLQNAGAKRPP